MRTLQECQLKTEDLLRISKQINDFLAGIHKKNLAFLDIRPGIFNLFLDFSRNLYR
jgi:hypothetical protein